MENRQELLELYKLHVEMADRVSQRRYQTNRFYLALTSGLFVLLSAVISGGGGDALFAAHGKTALLCAAGLGMLLCVIWFANVRSYKQLNQGKFKALLELEQQLPYPFYSKEWAFLQEGKKARVYLQLTTVEQFLPLFMLLPYAALFLFVCF